MAYIAHDTMQNVAGAHAGKRKERKEKNLFIWMQRNMKSLYLNVNIKTVQHVERTEKEIIQLVEYTRPRTTQKNWCLRLIFCWYRICPNF